MNEYALKFTIKVLESIIDFNDDDFDSIIDYIKGLKSGLENAIEILKESE